MQSIGRIEGGVAVRLVIDALMSTILLMPTFKVTGLAAICLKETRALVSSSVPNAASVGDLRTHTSGMNKDANGAKLGHFLAAFG